MLIVEEKESRLVNEGGSKSRRNEQVARSEAECQSDSYMQDDCLSTSMIDADGGEGSSPPSFLVHNKDNVNARFWRARGLITMWDFLEYKGRIGMTHVILQERKIPISLIIMPVSARSRSRNWWSQDAS